jgi:multidrug efflux pump subunit AcrA (membrane-fusion protein)
MTRSLKNNLWKRKRFWALLVCVLGAVGMGLTKHSGTPTGLTLGKVSRGDLIQKVTIAGSVTPIHKTIISAPYSGYVKKLYVQVGDKVKSGDPIVTLTQSLDSRHEEVYPMRAPFDGTVVQVLRVEGEYIDQTNANGSGIGIVRIDDLTHLRVEATSPELDVEKLKVGQEAVIKASSILGKSYQGRILTISLAAKEQKDWDKSRVEFSVQLDVLNPDPQLEPGMSVVCDIIANKLTNVLTLQHEFIQKSSDGKYTVTALDGSKKPIEVGLQNEEAFQVKSGVNEGEEVQQTDFLALLKKN